MIKGSLYYQSIKQALSDGTRLIIRDLAWAGVLIMSKKTSEVLTNTYRFVYDIREGISSQEYNFMRILCEKCSFCSQ